MSNKLIHDTREGWFKAAIAELDKEFFDGRGYKLPKKLQCSCGFPRGHAKAIGQCWDPEVSADGTTHLFICPTQADPMRVLDILLHELIHAAVGIKEGHKGMFKKLAKEFGLEGKMTATTVTPGSELHRQLAKIQTSLGKYPHAPMQKKAPKKGSGGSGWVRLVSPEDDTYKVVISPKVLEAHGAPQDPWGNEMELVGGEDE